MATPHIESKKEDIKRIVLMPGDPLRAKFVAENIFEDSVCYNDVRGMLGFTGMYKGNRVSVQGTGMGIPSLLIYGSELINDYGAKNLIRIGTCGTIQENVKIREIILAMTASTKSAIGNEIFNGAIFSPHANFKLLDKAYKIAIESGVKVHAGSVLTEDKFYNDDKEHWKLWAKFGVLGLEMETYGLYALAAKNNVNALSILTVSDNLLTGEETTSEEREKTFMNMVRIALETAID